MSITRSVFKLLAGILLTFTVSNTYGQLVVTPPDTSVCGDTVTLTATINSGGGVISTPISLSDDGYSSVIPIGFTFQYYGVNYTQCVIGANSVVNFNTSVGTYNPWVISQDIPGSQAELYNTVMGPWMDLNPATGGTISYATTGLAPNRKFVVTYCDVPYFSCSNMKMSTQIILNETTNIVEVHISSRVTGCSWNGDYAIEGVQNGTGTVATAVAGRNYPTIWGAVSSSHSFTWNGTTYLETAIPFSPIPINSAGIITWFQGHPSNNVVLGTGNTLDVSPPVQTVYYARVISCADTSIDSSIVRIGIGDTIDWYQVIDPTFCGHNTGQVILHGLNPGDTFTVFTNGVLPTPSLPPFQAIAQPDSSVTITGLVAGTYNVSAENSNGCPTNIINVTLVDPVFDVDSVTGVNPTICGANDGYVKFWGVDEANTGYIVTYNKDGVAQPPVNITSDGSKNAALTNLAPGVYDNIMFSNMFTCQTGPFGPFTFVEPPFSVDFDTVVTFDCETDRVQFIDQSIGVTQYAWDFGDGNTGTQASPLHTYQDQGVYTVTLVGTNGFCTDQKTISVSVVHPLDANFSVSKDSICNGETIFFTDNSIAYDGSGATSQWNYGDGSAIETTTNVSHQYTTDGVFTASLTLTDIIGCTSVETKQIVVASIAVEVGPQDTIACLADSMLLYSRTFNPPYFSDGIEYAWSPSTNLGSPNSSETFFYTEVPGDYTFVLTATGYPMACVAKDTLTVRIQPRPVLLNVTPNTVIKYGSDIQLHAEGVQYYIWTPPATLDNPDISSPVGSPLEPTVYTVYGMNEHGGCRDTAEVVVDIDYTMEEFIPSVFSPNGDGKNDVFRIRNVKFQKLVEFRVFNRWGKEVYNGTDANAGWDGRYNGAPQDPGVYTYLIRVTVPNGDARAYKGNITLIR